MGIKIKFELHIHVEKNEKKNACMKNSEKKTPSNGGFLESAANEVEHLKTSLSVSTVENYKTALRAFSRYLEHDVSVESIDQNLIKGFERWLRDENVSLNSISCYMRSLRSLLNRVGAENQSDAFKGIYTGRAKTEKRAISEADIISIKQIELPPHKFQYLVRDVFLFSYYALGMPFVDVAFLRRSQISGDKLVYHRHKTGQRIVVPLDPCIMEIIERYKSDSPYVFPLLKSTIPQKAYLEYLVMLNRYNRSLKSLAKKAGLNVRLTSYTARHTWASVAFASNVDTPVISQALGHTNTQTTLTYIKEINDDRLAKASHDINNRIKKGT